MTSLTPIPSPCQDFYSKQFRSSTRPWHGEGRSVQTDRLPEKRGEACITTLPLELRIDDLNVKGLPLVRHDDTQLEALAETLNGDVAFFQEVLTLRYRRFLWRQADYPYRHIPFWRVSLCSSGLATISRYPITKRKFFPFMTGASGWEILVSKGVQLTRIEHPSLGTIDVYNTHMQSDTDSKWGQNSALRIKQIARFIEVVKKNSPPDRMVILGGDFNMATDSPEYALLREGLPGFIDLIAEKHPGEALDSYNGDDANQTGPQRIDYVFIRPNSGLSLNMENTAADVQRYTGDLTITDHNRLEVKVQFELKTVQPHP
jgi:endonuclease/exonuclease/phosphatase family metal-dependent hydrolase